MYCIHCGKEYQEGARFCIRCGRPIENSPAGGIRENRGAQGGIQEVQEIQGIQEAQGMQEIWETQKTQEIPGAPVSPQYENAAPQSGPESVKRTTPKWVFITLGVTGAVLLLAVIIFAAVKGLSTFSSGKDPFEPNFNVWPQDTSIEKEELIGSWKADISIGYILQMAMSADGVSGAEEQKVKKVLSLMDRISGDVELPLYFCFEEDGRVVQIINKKEWASSLQEFILDMLDYMEDGGFYEVMEALTGMTREEIDESIPSGFSVEEYIENIKRTYEAVPSEQWSGMLSNLTPYKIDGYYQLNAREYELAKDEIIISSGNGSSPSKSSYSYKDGKLTLRIQPFEDSDKHFDLTLEKTRL